jgi:arabinofuranosyltransferase
MTTRSQPNEEEALAEEPGEETEGAPPPSGNATKEPARSFDEWTAGAPLPERLHLLFGLFLPMLLVLWNAWRVREFTVDDAYISFRFAQNLADGNGLVYNVGERVEGYTNFLWTLLLAGAARLGAPIEPAAKVLGALSASAALVPLYLLARRLRPLTTLPTIATWLLATSFLFTGYSVFGLETPFFIALILAGTEIFFREDAREGEGIPWSGLVFALAGLTRPEAPLFIGILMIWRPSGIFERKNLIRAALFVAPVAAHILFRRAYYGGWLPNTLTAKTGSLDQQLRGGSDYINNYLRHTGPILWLSFAAIAVAITRRRREGLAIASIAALFGLYVVFVGGDWMPYFRFLAPAEPFAFLLVDQALRAIAERKERAGTIAVIAFGFVGFVMRVSSLSSAQVNIIKNDKGFWDDAAGRTAEWFVKNGQPGPIAIADIGYVGWKTGYPIVDMLGLMAPEISKLPGGYTLKVGPGFTDAVFRRDPRYVVLIASNRDCKSPSKPFAKSMYSDSRFQSGFRIRQPVALKGGGAWCIYEKQADAKPH